VHGSCGRGSFDRVVRTEPLGFEADAAGYGISIRPCWLQSVSNATNRDEERHVVVFEGRIGVLTAD